MEHIIQDADSGPELEEWVRRNTTAQLVVERDASMYDGINRGLRRTKGDICAYLNCDEQYLPGTLRRVADYFGQHPDMDVVFGDAILTDCSLQPLSYRRVIPPRRWHTMLCPLGVLTCAMFFRRKLIDDGALFDPAWKIIGDKAWILSLLDRGYRMSVLPEPLAVFTLTGDNLSLHQNVHAERLRWEKSVSPMLRWAKPLVRIGHFLEKWRQGAYKIRRVDSAWYTPDSLAVRRRFAGLTLSWKWPSISSHRAS